MKIGHNDRFLSKTNTIIISIKSYMHFVSCLSQFSINITWWHVCHANYISLRCFIVTYPLSVCAHFLLGGAAKELSHDVA